MSNPATGPDSLGSCPNFYRFDDFASFEAAFAAGGSLKGKVIRQIVCMTDCVLNVTKPGGGGTVLWPCATNVPEPIQIIAFAAASSTGSPSSTYPIKVYL